MLDEIQRYLLKSHGTLGALQSIDLGLHEPDSAEARKLLKQFVAAASEGDTYAMAVCSACYRTGWGTKPDAAAAFHWAHMAASLGFPPGLEQLAYCYEEAIGTESNPTLALSLHEAAVAAGYGAAATNLALRYATGIPYGRSLEYARNYAEVAFKLGEPFAGYLLGRWWEDGAFGHRNVASAKAWFEAAASNGSKSACHRLAMACLTGDLGLPVDPGKSEDFLELAKCGSSA